MPRPHAVVDRVLTMRLDDHVLARPERYIGPAARYEADAWVVAV
jgi:hypothetical protein